jgi:hypothetical protein
VNLSAGEANRDEPDYGNFQLPHIVYANVQQDTAALRCRADIHVQSSWLARG